MVSPKDRAQLCFLKLQIESWRLSLSDFDGITQGQRPAPQPQLEGTGLASPQAEARNNAAAALHHLLSWLCLNATAKAAEY